jgi:hypothetical protein
MQACMIMPNMIIENERGKNEVYVIDELMGHPCNRGEVAHVWHALFKHTMLCVILMFMMRYKMISSRSGGLGMTHTRLLYTYLK